MKATIRALLLFFMIIAAIVMLFILRALLPWRDKTDTFFVNNTQFERTNFSDITPKYKLIESGKYDELKDTTIMFSVQNHRITQGEGDILAWRLFSDRMPLVMDDEQFEKLTIWIRNVSIGKLSIGDSNQVIAYYTRGGSAWPDAGCGAELKNGIIDISEKADNSITLHLQSNITCTNPNRPNKKAETFKLNENYKFKKFNFSELTPWHGLKGKHIYDETYRRL